MEKKTEDRVFGRVETFPAPPIVTRPSTASDLISVSVEGAEIVYAAEGRASLPPLLFLHGWGASHKFWKYALPAFAPRHRCVAPDLVGFGLSEKPDRDYTVEGLASWLGKFMDALGWSRVPIVGHSLGGTVALLFALEHPERVEKLVVVNPLVQGATAFGTRTRVLMMPGLRSLMYALSHARPVRRWIARDYCAGPLIEEELIDDITRGSHRSLIDSLVSLGRTDLTPRLASLRVPTFAIGTDEDRILAPAQFDLIPAARKVRLAQTGHIPMVERPEEFNRTLNELLAT